MELTRVLCPECGHPHEEWRIECTGTLVVYKIFRCQDCKSWFLMIYKYKDGQGFWTNQKLTKEEYAQLHNQKTRTTKKKTG